MGYMLHNIDEKTYVLIRDIVNKWFTKVPGGGGTTSLRKTIAKYFPKICLHQIPVTLPYGNKKVNKIVWAIEQQHVLEVEEFLTQRPGGSGRPRLQIPIEREIANSFFYILQKYPTYAPQILKLGQTGRSAEARSKEFNVFEPKILLECKIRPSFETTLIAMISKGQIRLGQEEFWVEDTSAFIKNAEAIISFLPNDCGEAIS